MNIDLSKSENTTTEKYFNYSYGRYYSNGVLVLNAILAIAGFVIISFSAETSLFFIFPGLLMIGLGVLAFFPQELLQINNVTREYRVAFKLGSYLKGDWKNIGDVQYLSIINMKKYINLGGDEEGNIYSGDIIQECRLRLYKRAGYTIDIDDYKSKESAIVIGKIIAAGLNLRLLDATERPPFFIDL